jgi:CheY-like chemotaxis protein
MMKIVLIDDDRDDGELFREALHGIDPSLEFDYYEDPKEALQRLAETEKDHPGQPRIIFLDINMPVVNGWECLTKFKKMKELEKVPVIMFTTSSMEKEKTMAKEMGAAGFITKPDDFLTLKEMLNAVIKERIQAIITEG